MVHKLPRGFGKSAGFTIVIQGIRLSHALDSYKIMTFKTNREWEKVL
jgi:hypothetical protein